MTRNKAHDETRISQANTLILNNEKAVSDSLENRVELLYELLGGIMGFDEFFYYWRMAYSLCAIKYYLFPDGNLPKELLKKNGDYNIFNVFIVMFVNNLANDSLTKEISTAYLIDGIDELVGIHALKNNLNISNTVVSDIDFAKIITSDLSKILNFDKLDEAIKMFLKTANKVNGEFLIDCILLLNFYINDILELGVMLSVEKKDGEVLMRDTQVATSEEGKMVSLRFKL